MKIKVCGLKSVKEVEFASKAGADYVGFVFYNPSPRGISYNLGKSLCQATPKGVSRVALVINPDEAMLESLKAIDFDFLQLHGSETVERVKEVKEVLQLPVIKSVGVGVKSDLRVVDLYSSVADQILIDAKAPVNSSLPGGNGICFNWDILEGYNWECPWMLAGGLNTRNVSKAILKTGARQVDISSGVEDFPGKKNLEKIEAFITKVKGL
jgi:phosphoribosylanthranilate isomerase